MNSVNLIGRITKDVNYSTSENGNNRAIFSLAIDRGKDREGNDLGADFPGIICFGKLAENVSKFCHKGMLVGVSGRIVTSAYDKDGTRFYTTSVMANSVQFLEKRSE